MGGAGSNKHVILVGLHICMETWAQQCYTCLLRLLVLLDWSVSDVVNKAHMC